MSQVELAMKDTVEVTGDPDPLDRAIPSGDAAVWRDLADLRAAKEALVRSESVLDLVAATSLDAIGLTRDGEVEWMSPAIEDVLGIPATEVTGADLVAAVHPDDVAVVAAGRRGLDAGETVKVRCRVRHRDGSWHWVELRSRAICDPSHRRAEPACWHT